MKVIIVAAAMTGALLVFFISAFSQGKVEVSLIEARLPNKVYPDF
ncbi:MAG: hypothetical protein ACTS7E_02870 [Arsenophonus sp. NC-CH8-MAG3]